VAFQASRAALLATVPADDCRVADAPDSANKRTRHPVRRRVSNVDESTIASTPITHRRISR